MSIDTTKLTESKVVRDSRVEYEIRGPLVYLGIGFNVDLQSVIDAKKISKQEKENRKVEEGNSNVIDHELRNNDIAMNSNKGRAKASKRNMNKNKQSIVQEQLDYSDNSSFASKILNTVTTRRIIHKFNLFSNKIHVNELKDKMELHLVKKNVDYEIAKILTECVMNQLKEENIEYVACDKFKSLMTDVLSRLMPSVDHDKMCSNMRNSSNIYSICFVGVNGVGKSTSLAKVCCWLLEQNLRVYIAACDTFRAGAVEQLKTHVDRFRSAGYDVGFYEKGYGKDDASVAKMACSLAQKEGYDVILIDTAGRMHNKTSLMMSLSKLIKVNEPDHIVYVGEALVGSDSLNHIKEFNNYIRQGSAEKHIDSILLTKVDTVDDKIGQILNMTFSSRAPILFLGTGQTNSDLTKIASGVVVDSILS